jgi:hypothetical protein
MGFSVARGLAGLGVAASARPETPARKRLKSRGATIEFRFNERVVLMWLIFLEAGLALVIFIFIVWWTMRGKR